MDSLDLRVFNVGQGLSVALIEKPEHYVTLVDLGSNTGFTPLKFMRLKLNLRPDIVYITHPHADHINDVETALDQNFRPLGINYQTYEWADVKGREQPQLRYKIDKFKELIQLVPHKNYAGNAKLEVFRYTPAEAKKYWGDASYVNNSSYFLVYTWQTFKISIAGDLESNGMKAMVGADNVQTEARGTYILIPSHHAHTNGFPTEWVSRMGKPHVSIISVQSRDPNVDCRYSSPNFAQGVRWDSEQGTCYTLTTRGKGHIVVQMSYGPSGNAQWSFNSFQ